MQKTAVIALVTIQLVATVSCSPVGGRADAGTDSSGLTAEQRAAGWKLLFDGESLSGWRAYREKTLPASWHFADGNLVKENRDIITIDQFGDFELAFDWKISKDGNAGLFYRATEEYDKIYWSAPEYQLLDDAGHADGKNRLTAAGAAYALYPAPAGVVKPFDQWNSARIVARGTHIEHWLNGQKLLEYEIRSPDWEAKVRASKFVEYPKYGRATRGHIGLQGDHDGRLTLRNLRIKELN